MQLIGRLDESVWTQWHEVRHAAAVIGTVFSTGVGLRCWEHAVRRAFARQVLAIGVEPLWFIAVVARELAPVLVNLIVIIRSGSAMATELGLLKIKGDVAALQAQGSDPLTHLVLPRVLGMAAATFCLTIVFVLIAFVSGHLVDGPAAHGQSHGRSHPRTGAAGHVTMHQLQLVVTNLDTAVKNIETGSARFPEITEAGANETKDLPGLVLPTKTYMWEMERLIEALQKHWLVRKHVNPTDPPPTRPIPSSEETPKKPVKRSREPRNPAR